MLYSLAKRIINPAKTESVTYKKHRMRRRKTHRAKYKVHFRPEQIAHETPKQPYTRRRIRRRFRRQFGGDGSDNSGSTVREVGENKKIIGRFYANWCGHCQRMAQDWKKVVQLLNDELKGFSYFNIEHGNNMEKHKKNLEQHVKGEVKVDGFPTIFKVIDGKIEYFDHAVHTNGKTLYDKIRNFYLTPPS